MGLMGEAGFEGAVLGDVFEGPDPSGHVVPVVAECPPSSNSHALAAVDAVDGDL